MSIAHNEDYTHLQHTKSEQSQEEITIYRNQLDGYTKENLEEIENKESK